MAVAQYLPQISAKMALGFATNQIMERKSSQSCNHVCMDAMQDKQKSISDEWTVIEIASLVRVLRVGWQ